MSRTQSMTGSRGGGRWAAAIAVSLLVFAALALAAPARAAVPQFTPVSASVLAPPEPITGTDGRLHLVYEILLQNTAGVRLDVQSLAVRAPDGGTLLTVAED